MKAQIFDEFFVRHHAQSAVDVSVDQIFLKISTPEGSKLPGQAAQQVDKAHGSSSIRREHVENISLAFRLELEEAQKVERPCRRSLWLMRWPMVDEFTSPREIAKLNIEHFRKLLQTSLDDQTRARVERLLADEKSNLAALQRADDPGQQKKRG